MIFFEFIFCALLCIFSVFGEDVSISPVPVDRVCVGENEYFNIYASACPATCENMYQAIKCTDNYVRRCDCMAGYVRNSKNQCVTPIDCLPEEVSCPTGQVFQNCFGCIQRFCSDATEVITASTKESIRLCPAVCNTGCVCEQSKLVIDDVNGAGCIPVEQCPITPACKRNEFWNPCASSCPRTCANLYQDNNICNKMCNSRCDCIGGYVRNNAGDCIVDSSCPISEIQCPQNQEVNVCYSSCEPRTCSAVNKIPILTTKPAVDSITIPLCMKMCDLGCSCSNGYVFDDINNRGCISIEECAKLSCSENEYEDPCGNTCKPTCADPNPYLCIVRICKRLCICKPPLVRDEITGECIDKNTCQSRCSGINQVMYPTRSFAQETCANYGQPRPEIPTQNNVCDCKEEFVFDEVRQECVPPYLCNCPL